MEVTTSITGACSTLLPSFFKTDLFSSMATCVRAVQKGHISLTVVQGLQIQLKGFR